MSAIEADVIREQRPFRFTRLIPGGNRTMLLVLPSAAIFVIFFIVPVVMMLAIAFNPGKAGALDFESDNLTLDNFRRIFERPLYWEALVRSVELSVLTAVLALIFGYPLAFFVAKEQRPGRANLYMIMILASMQLDLIIRMYGLMILLGDAGLINDTLMRWGVISDPLPLMYNKFGVIVGMVQLSLPFMILSLIGVIQGINPSLEEAARSLGAGRWRTFFTITFPMSMPGVLAGSLLVFAIAIGSYAVPTLMGGWRVFMTPMHISQQVMEKANWRFGASIACLLFLISIAATYLYHRYTQKHIGGLV